MQPLTQVMDIVQSRGEQRKPLQRIYRYLLRTDLLLQSYEAIGKNRGAMTRGSDKETVDGMSLKRINSIREQLATGQWHWKPVRRTYIPKKSGGNRPLGMPTWPDKLVQQAIKMILETYYEPQFSDLSFGFRPGRGCHDALQTIKHVWRGVTWFVEGDIKGCFDNIDHDVLMSILGRQIHDRKFLSLIRGMLKAGYMEELQWTRTLSGTPQGGIASPLLANIYLNELDHFVEENLIPRFTRGEKRAKNKEYFRLHTRMRKARERGDLESATNSRKQLQQIPSVDPNDPDYRRLRYVRYADDFILGLIGPKADAVAIKAEISNFVTNELRLELSETKTLITHAPSKPARFLGYDVRVCREQSKHTRGRRSMMGEAVLSVPRSAVQAKVSEFKRNQKVIHRNEFLGMSDYQMVTAYNSILRGMYEYYCLAHDVSVRINELRWVLQTSLLRTLACKYKSTVMRMLRKYRRKTPTRSFIAVSVETPNGIRTATFGQFSLARKKYPDMPEPRVWYPLRPYSDMITRLMAGRCELCGDKEGPFENHHVRRLKDLVLIPAKERAPWMKIMLDIRRKTLVVCEKCHTAIHNDDRGVTTL